MAFILFCRRAFRKKDKKIGKNNNKNTGRDCSLLARGVLGDDPPPRLL